MQLKLRGRHSSDLYSARSYNGVTAKLNAFWVSGPLYYNLLLLYIRYVL